MFGFGGKVETVIGEGAQIKGSLRASESIFVNGRVEGDVHCEGVLTLGAKSLVHGDLKAPVVVVGGKVNGDVHAYERAELLATAEISGDIRAPRMAVAEGAVIHGRCEMIPPPDERAETKAVTRRLS